jgi:ribosome assembly protein 1
MIAIPIEQLPRRPAGQAYHLDQADIRGSDESNAGVSGKGECFVAFARVFSGRLREGERVFVLLAGYDPTDPKGSKRHIQMGTFVLGFWCFGCTYVVKRRTESGHESHPNRT